MYKDFAIGCALAGCLAASDAWSQETGNEAYDPAALQVVVGGGAAFVPDYEGSDETRILPFPLIMVSWDRLRFAGTSLNVAIVRTETVTAGAIATLRFGRNASENAALTGVGDTATAVDVGGFADFALGPVDLGVRATQDVVGDGGVLITGGISRRQPLSQRLTITPRVELTWADAKYMRVNFGIDSLQSAASGYSAYRPKAGLKDVSAGAMIEYDVTKRWSVLLSGSYHRLFDEPGKSPFVDGPGSRDQFTAFAGIAYRF